MDKELGNVALDRVVDFYISCDDDPPKPTLRGLTFSMNVMQDSGIPREYVFCAMDDQAKLYWLNALQTTINRFREEGNNKGSVIVIGAVTKGLHIDKDTNVDDIMASFPNHRPPPVAMGAPPRNRAATSSQQQKYAAPRPQSSGTRRNTDSTSMQRPLPSMQRPPPVAQRPPPSTIGLITAPSARPPPPGSLQPNRGRPMPEQRTQQQQYYQEDPSQYPQQESHDAFNPHYPPQQFEYEAQPQYAAPPSRRLPPQSSQLPPLPASPRRPAPPSAETLPELYDRFETCAVLPERDLPAMAAPLPPGGRRAVASPRRGPSEKAPAQQRAPPVRVEALSSPFDETSSGFDSMKPENPETGLQSIDYEREAELAAAAAAAAVEEAIDVENDDTEEADLAYENIGDFEAPNELSQDTEEALELGFEEAEQRLAVFDFEAEDDDQMSMAAGDKVIVESIEGDWLMGVNVITGCQGWVPTNHTAKIK